MNSKRVRNGLVAAAIAFVAVVAAALLLFFVSGDEADLSYRSVDFERSCKATATSSSRNIWTTS